MRTLEPTQEARAGDAPATVEGTPMPDESTPRIAPLLPADWDAAAYDAMSVLPHGRDNILAAAKAGLRNLGSNLVCTQLRHPVLTKAFLTFNAHHFYTTTLPARMRELLIIRIGWLMRAETEYLAHVAIGKRHGLSDADIERIQRGPDAPGLDPLDADLLRAVDELHKESGISGATYERLAAHLDEKQLIDLVFLVGCYANLAWFMNSFRVQLEPGVEPIDPATRARMGT
jgi:alkylhydroperoxidase family enzyme